MLNNCFNVFPPILWTGYCVPFAVRKWLRLPVLREMERKWGWHKRLKRGKWDLEKKRRFRSNRKRERKEKWTVWSWQNEMAAKCAFVFYKGWEKERQNPAICTLADARMLKQKPLQYQRLVKFTHLPPSIYSRCFILPFILCMLILSSPTQLLSISIATAARKHCTFSPSYCTRLPVPKPFISHRNTP